MERKITDLIDGKLIYIAEEQNIYIEDADGRIRLLLELRGWAPIQKLFSNKKGAVDFKEAGKFQDKIGEWVIDSLNESLNKIKHIEDEKDRLQ